jgi:RHS repeat-associated protein
VRDGASPTGALRFSQDDQRDKLGRITRRTETLGSTVVVYDYTYDLAGRLETVSVDGKEVSRYGFDSNGNRLSRVTPEGSVSGTYDAQDRMLSYGPCSWSYDGHGDTQARTCSANRASAAEARFPAGETRYRYDVFSNLRRVEMPDGRVIEYLIDGSNRRVGRLVNGQLTQRLIYKDQLEPIAEFDGAGQLKAWFIYADRAHVPSLMLRPENGSEVAYRLIADHLGSVRLVVRLQDGVVVQRIDYDEYGVVVSDSNPGFQPFGYAGGIDDREAGLVRFGARDYDPLTGRWLTKDPIGFRGGLNMFSYVDADPIGFVDITGLDFLGKDLAREYIRKYGGGAWEQIRGDRDSTRPVAPGTESEAMRNAEHYLYARLKVTENSYSWGPMHLLALGYNTTKFWGNVGEYYGAFDSPWTYSIPTSDELQAGFEGANDGLFGDPECNR